MPRNITLRCSDAVYKRIQTAIAVRGSGLFPPVEVDPETTEEAATVAAILADWKAGLTPESIAKARDEHFDRLGLTASLDDAYRHEHQYQPADEQKAELPPKRKSKADDGI